MRPCALAVVSTPGLAFVIAVMLSVNPGDGVTDTLVGGFTTGAKLMTDSTQLVAPSRRSSRGAWLGCTSVMTSALCT